MLTTNVILEKKETKIWGKDAKKFFPGGTISTKEKLKY